MSHSDQLRPLRRYLSAGLAACCASVLVGCGGSEDSATSAAPAGDSSSAGASTSQGMTSVQGGDHGASDGSQTMSAAPGMGGSGNGMGGSAPAMNGSAPDSGGHAATNDNSTMTNAPGMSATIPGGGGGHGASGGSAMASGPPGMGGISGGYNGMDPNASYGGGYSGGPAAVAQTVRPSAFDKWTDEDFLSAAREHDPRVLEAIDYKVKSAPGDPGVVTLLTSLLDLPPLPVQTNPGGAASGYPGMPGAPGGAGGPGSGDSHAAPSTTTPPGPNRAPAMLSAPQASLGKPDQKVSSNQVSDPRIALDSVSAMILEASVTYVPQGAAVGAIAGGVEGRMEGLTGQAPGSAATPNYNQSPPGGSTPAMPPGYAGAGYPGAESPGNGYPGGNMQGVGGQVNAGQLQSRSLVEKVVDGLITNNSSEAWQSVFGIVAGAVKTPLPPETNCEIVVERLIQNMNSNPDLIQPVILAFLDGEQKIPSESRTACMRMLAAISATQTGKLTGFAMQEKPAAAPGFGGTSGYPGGTDAGYPGMGSSPGMGGYPGMGGSPGMGGPTGNAAVTKVSSLPQVTLAPDVAEAGANFLWSPKTIAAILSQLEKASDLHSVSDVILLASTIPGEEVRRAICGALIRMHSSESDVLDPTGLFTNVHDPGMLVILKALPRTRPSKDAPGAMDSWTSGTQSLVLALRDELKRTSGSMKQYTDTLPVKLHKNATAEISVMMQFPAGSAEPATGKIPSATQVYYTRTNFTPQGRHDGDDLISHYTGRTSGYDRPDEAKGLRWIEGVKVLPNGHRRTMDVIVQKGGVNAQAGFPGGPGGTGESGYGGSGAGGSYTVEIIVVDTVDPKAP